MKHTTLWFQKAQFPKWSDVLNFIVTAGYVANKPTDLGQEWRVVVCRRVDAGRLRMHEAIGLQDRMLCEAFVLPSNQGAGPR